MRVPFLRPPLGVNEWRAIYSVMTGSNISTGPERAEFENNFKEYIDVPYALAVANGTIGLELVWETLIKNGKLKKYDKILCPTFTFVACANSIIKQGLIPVFCDIDRDTWNLDFQWDDEDISGILSVHTFGTPCDCDEITYLKEKGLVVVEDCCESAGAEYRGKKVGRYGDASIFSFNATKNMTTGEGGMVCFQDKEDADVALLLAENGFGYGARSAIIPGHNYRLSNLQCAIGIEQLKTLDCRNCERVKNAAKIFTLLCEGGFNDDQFQAINHDHVYQIFGILVDDRDSVYNHLIKNGIEVKKYFSPAIHEQDYYHKNYVHPDFPVTDCVSQDIICLPMYPSLTDEDISYMCEKVLEVV